MATTGPAPAGQRCAPRVRLATADDMPRIHAMIQELAEFEGFPTGPRLAVPDLVADGFSEQPWFFTLVAELGDRSELAELGDRSELAGLGDRSELAGLGDRSELAGYALCNRAYSSWTGRAFYVEDLYVRPERRRAGVGRALMARLAQMALTLAVSRIDWHVLCSNEGALRFYRRLGARDLRVTEGRAALRLDPEHVRALADTHTSVCCI